MSNLSRPLYSEYQTAQLERRAIGPDDAARAGVLSLADAADLPTGAPEHWGTLPGFLPGLAFPWRSLAQAADPFGDVTVQWQLKPDAPVLDDEGRPRKYLFPKGFQPVLNPIRIPAEGRSGNDHGPLDRVLIVEGTHQAIAAGIYAPPGWSVLGISGCRGWSVEGLPVADLLQLDGATVVIALDSDMGRNLQVWEAGQALARELDMSDAASVRFAHVTGSGTTGLDDVLGGRPQAARHTYMVKLLEPGRCTEASKVKRPTRDADAAARREREAATRAANEQAETIREAAEGRPRLDVSGDRQEVVGALIEVLKRWDGTSLFNRGGALTRREGDTLVPLDRHTLCDRLATGCRTGHPDARTGAWIDGWPDDATLGVVLVRARAFLPLVGLASAPFLRLDGTVCAVNGYDAASRTYLRMPPQLAERLVIPDEPSGEDVRAAVKLLLDDWLGDMPFPGPADRAAVLALILTPFLREWFDIVPVCVLDGNGPSAGKGLLAEVYARLVLGHPVDPRALPTDNEEMRKQITSAMSAGGSLLIWDEAHELSGTALAQLLTAPTWRDRRLGTSTDIVVENRTTFVALGNNVRVEGDIGRRAYRVRIHPEGERPEDRDANGFRHPNLRAWTTEHRAELLSAVLVLVRAWVVEGKPDGRADMGSFEHWSATVGGVLEVAGVEGFLEGRREWLVGSNTTETGWAEHLGWLQATFKGRPFKTSDAVQALVRGGIDVPLPPGRAVSSPESTGRYAQALGMVYNHRKDRPFYGLTLRKDGITDGSARWSVQGKKDETDISTTSLAELVDNKGSKGTNGGSLNQTQTTPPTKGVGGRWCTGPRVETPPSSPPTPLDPQSYADDLLEGYALTQTSECPDCGTAEVLVDGLWYACPACHPATARTNQD